MQFPLRRLAVGAVFAGFFALPSPAEAQIGQRIRDTAKRAAERETLREVDRQVTNAVRCTFDDRECIRRAESEGKQVEVVDQQGNVVPSGQGAPAAAASVRPGEGAWANYDFVPGERILFADDFLRDQVGDFPRRLEFKEGSMEVVEWQGARFLRATGSTNNFLVNLPETLPERYTIEFDYANAHGYGWGGLRIGFAGQNPAYHSGVSELVCNHDNAGIEGGEVKAIRAHGGNLANEVFRCRLMVDGDYAKVYVNEVRVANVPNAKIPRTNQLWVSVSTRDSQNHPAMLGNIRIAAGGRRLYDALAAEGRVSTQGIMFDTGSDRIRPESTPTLKEIGEMLRQHGDLRIRIEGHTDNVGQAAANQTLSERRAAAVKEHLVSSYGIEDGRLETQGLGASKPSASNDTPEGRQTNRRVELVRL